MNGILAMFRQGAGIGAWVVGAGLVLTAALPVFGVLFAVIAKVLKPGGRATDRREG